MWLSLQVPPVWLRRLDNDTSVVERLRGVRPFKDLSNPIIHRAKEEDLPLGDADRSHFFDDTTRVAVNRVEADGGS